MKEGSRRRERASRRAVVAMKGVRRERVNARGVRSDFAVLDCTALPSLSAAVVLPLRIWS